MEGLNKEEIEIVLEALNYRQKKLKSSVVYKPTPEEVLEVLNKINTIKVIIYKLERL